MKVVTNEVVFSLFGIWACPQEPAEQIPHRAKEVANRKDNKDQAEDLYDIVCDDLVHDVVEIGQSVLSEILAYNSILQLSVVVRLDHCGERLWLNKLHYAVNLQQFEKLQQ